MGQETVIPIPDSFRPIIRSIGSGEPLRWPVVAGDPENERFLRASADHGIQPLLYESLSRFEDVPPALTESLRRVAVIEAAADVARTAFTSEIAAEAALRGIPLLVIKGAALALTHYSTSHLRPRADLDVLIGDQDRIAMDALLRERGCRRLAALQNETLFAQENWVRSDGAGARLAVDLHWRLSNLAMLAERFEFDELFRRGIEIPTAGGPMRVPSSSDALIIAAVHLAAHHPSSPRLIWLYDLHLLIESLSPAEESAMWKRSAELGVSRICASSLELARGWFGTRPAPAPLRPAHEPSAALLDPGRTRLRDALLQIRYARGWRTRMDYLRAQLFPPAAYMRSRSPRASSTWLPILYLRRLVGGIPKLLRRP
ncbi:MAG TPA: nucleotidyltransferase family protein [Thermoanaerobaculia bacterium]|nr:nucleotidyltransferase family protein [Thermoanaerobaculia bacterium]